MPLGRIFSRTSRFLQSPRRYLVSRRAGDIRRMIERNLYNRSQAVNLLSPEELRIWRQLHGGKGALPTQVVERARDVIYKPLYSGPKAVKQFVGGVFGQGPNGRRTILKPGKFAGWASGAEKIKVSPQAEFDLRTGIGSARRYQPKLLDYVLGQRKTLPGRYKRFYSLNQPGRRFLTGQMEPTGIKSISELSGMERGIGRYAQRIVRQSKTLSPESQERVNRALAALNLATQKGIGIPQALDELQRTQQIPWSTRKKITGAYRALERERLARRLMQESLRGSRVHERTYLPELIRNQLWLTRKEERNYLTTLARARRKALRTPGRLLEGSIRGEIPAGLTGRQRAGMTARYMAEPLGVLAGGAALVGTPGLSAYTNWKRKQLKKRSYSTTLQKRGYRRLSLSSNTEPETTYEKKRALKRLLLGALAIGGAVGLAAIIRNAPGIRSSGRVPHITDSSSMAENKIDEIINNSNVTGQTVDYVKDEVHRLTPEEKEQRLKTIKAKHWRRSLGSEGTPSKIDEGVILGRGGEEIITPTDINYLSTILGRVTGMRRKWNKWKKEESAEGILI